MASQLCRQLGVCFPHNAYVAISPAPESDVPVWSPVRWRWNKRGGCPLFSFSLLWTLPGMLRRHRIDVLHVHAGSGGVWLLRKPACPVVVTAHHSYAQEASAVFAATPLKRLWKRLMSLLERRTYAVADHIACVSADTLQVLHTAYGIPLERMSVVENAVDVERFQPPVPDVRQQHTVLFAGRLEARKGIWVFLRAMSRIRSQCPQVRFRFCGQNLIGSQLHSVLERERLNDVTTVLGRVHEPFLIRELVSASVVVVPSLVEGFGLLAAEAMACGCCVVASDCDGLRSLVTHRVTGLLFPTGDASALTDCVVLALQNPQLRQTLGKQAWQQAQERFSFTRQAQQMQLCFDRLAS